MKQAILCICTLLQITAIQAQDTEWHFSMRSYDASPKVGLALSGGAAHGLAHIGVIQYLDDIGIEIDYITGTSMGAIIGALYAMGYTGDQMAEVAAEVDWDGILSNRIRYNEAAPIEKFFHDKYPLSFDVNDRRILLPQGILNTNRLEIELARLFSPALDRPDFDDLPIPFRCFGVDIESGEVVTMSKGRLPDALRASMAIPSIFSPSQYEGRWLVDGGLIKNFPVIENFEMGADIVIGSYVGREKSDMTEMLDLLDILSESTFMMSIADSKIQKERTDILVCPDVKELALFGFDDYQQLIRLGYLSAKRHMQDLLSLREIQGRFSRRDTLIAVPRPEYLYIDEIRFDDIPDADKKLALDKFEHKANTNLSYRMIEQGIARISATLNFESVTYHMDTKEGRTILHIAAKPREYRQLGVNINHFSDTNSSLILSGQIRNLLLRLSNFRATIRLSENPGISGEYYVRAGLSSKNWVAGVRVVATKEQKRFFSGDRQRKVGFLWEGHIEPYLLYEFDNGRSLRASFDLRRFDFNNEVVAALDLRRIVNNSTRAGLQWTLDTRTSRVLPKNGSLMVVSAGYGFSADDSPEYNSSEAIGAISFPESASYFDAEFLMSQIVPISPKVRLELLVDFFYKSAPSLLDGYTIGGTSFISERSLPFIGYRLAEINTDRHGYLRSALRIDVVNSITASIIVNGIMGSNQAFLYYDESRADSFSAFGVGIELGVDTPVGPVLFDLGFNSESKDVVGELSIGWRHFF